MVDMGDLSLEEGAHDGRARVRDEAVLPVVIGWTVWYPRTTYCAALPERLISPSSGAFADRSFYSHTGQPSVDLPAKTVHMC